jgi:TatD DNase family protein
MTLIDTHCHLTDERFTDIKDVLKKARSGGVTKVIMPSTSLADAKRAAAIAVQENQYCLAGIHPEELETVEDMDTEVEGIKKIIESSSRVVGIGEIGLDFYFDKEKKTEKKQIELFRKQMELAVELRMPVAIHMREAETEMVREMEQMHRLPTGQFHCFAGSEDFLEMILAKGFYVSFAGNITYKSASNLRELIRKVPLNRLLLETDSPYLAPEPVRGTVNEPANVKIIAEFVAQELNLEPLKLAELTCQNTKCLYSLDI